MDVFQIAETELSKITLKREHVGSYFRTYIYMSHIVDLCVFYDNSNIYRKYFGVFFTPKISILRGISLNLVIKS